MVVCYSSPDRLRQWAPVAKSYRQPLGAESSPQLTARKQGPRSYSCKEVGTVNNLDEVDSSPVETPDENAALVP